MKHEWRKKEKTIYIPKNKPEVIDIPNYNFITIEGAGSPASKLFSECIGVLYALSYAVKMLQKKEDVKPKGYYDYTVYPLEGLWDLNKEAKKRFDGTINKNDFVYKLMIRQPDFLDKEYFNKILELTKSKKPHQLLTKVRFESLTEGKCVQMLHQGSYDDEPESFQLMEEFSLKENLIRKSEVHREIYLSDFRKVTPEKLKTVLRFQVKNN